MTREEKLKQVLSGYDFEKGDVDSMVAYAYYRGLCTGVKRVSDKAQKIFSEQHAAADKCRYYNMANSIIYSDYFIFDSDYDQWINIFADDIIDDDL